MARIDYAVSVTPIQDGTHSTTYSSDHANANTTNVDDDYVDKNVGRSLGGGKSDTAWAGSAFASNHWNAGTHTHISSNASTGTDIVVDSGAEGLWIKHTGFKFDSGLSSTAETTSKVIVYAIGGSVEVCRLSSGQAIFFPASKNGTWKIKDDAGGEVVAVEYGIFT